MKYSVVISTYNGEKYIEELLESIREQEKKADEVIIIDDQSSDNTVDIIDKYISKWELDHWILKKNDVNLGWKKNFYKAIMMATGDYILTCDQDDIWRRDKIKKMSIVLENNKDIKLLCSDYELLYEKDSLIYPKRKVSDIANDNSVERLEFKKSFMVVDRPGCTFAIKEDLRHVMKKMYFDEYAHDALAWRAAALVDGLYIYHVPLICFRRHGNNASTSQKLHNKRLEYTTRILEAEYFYNVCIRALSINDICERNIKYVKGFYEMAKNRLLFLNNKSIIKALLGIRYIKYYPYFKTYFSDVFVLLFK